MDPSADGYVRQPQAGKAEIDSVVYQEHILLLNLHTCLTKININKIYAFLAG